MRYYEKQHTIEQYGYHFMRFTNEEILFDTENVLAQIEKYFE
jgi:very-short-patch-repair endonuclease